MTKIVFLDNQKQIKESKGNYKFIIRRTNTKLKKNTQLLDDFSKGLKYNKEFYDPYWIQRWANKKIYKNQNIKQLLIYNNQTLWPFFEYLTYASMIGISAPSSGYLLYHIDLIEKILSKHKPKIVIIQNNQQTIYKLVSEVCKNKNIRVYNLNKKSKREKTYSTNKKTMFNTYLYFRFLSRYLIGLISKKQQQSEALIISGHRFAKGTADENKFWGTIVKELKKNNITSKTIEYDGLWTLDSLKQMAHRHITRTDTEFIGKYYTPKTLMKTRKLQKFMLNKWGKLKQSKEFKQSLTYKNIDLQKYLEPRFNILFNSFSLFFAEVLTTTNQILKKEKPKIVLMEHEYNYYGLGFLMNSKNYDIKTIAMEFEAVNKRTSVHRHIKNKSIQNKESPLWRPIPDIKCVSGKHTKKILEKYCNMPKENLRITGQPRFDSLNKKQKHSKQSILKKHKFPNKKIITYGTKFRINEDPVLNKITDFVNSRDDLFLILKLAPNHPSSHLKNRVRESQNVKIIRDIDTRELLQVTDLFITDRSTLGIEAIVKDCPMIVFDFNKSLTFPYLTLGAAQEVKTINQFPGTIQTCLYDKKTLKNLKQGRKKFLKEYMYKLDGKSAQRVVEIISKMI
tara:strand:- start:3405 stop:5270 length:1866 start_codon:yes stop_codon:yes gene_type:complete